MVEQGGEAVSPGALAQRAVVLGWIAAGLSLAINNGLLIVTKIVTVNYWEVIHPTDVAPLSAFFLPAAWIFTVLLAAGTGWMAYISMESDLKRKRKRNRNLEPKPKIDWWDSCWGLIAYGAAIYHLAWLFQDLMDWRM